MSKTKQKPTAEEVERRFDAGEDIMDVVDKRSRVVDEPDEAFRIRRVNVDFPTWMIRRLDSEATRLGINRQAVIKTVVAHHLDTLAK